ncbi:MAG: hypothetical protein ACRDZ8_04675 [Acidimicrobiales bacterium]
MDDLPLEASPDDVAAQREEVLPDPGDEFAPAPASSVGPLSFEADPADVAEQRAEVPLDDEDWG